MERRQRLWQRIRQGHVNNIDFGDILDLAEAFGFQAAGGDGSHRRYSHPGLAAGLNFQDDRGQAKPYQVRQLRRLVEEHRLTLED